MPQKYSLRTLTLSLALGAGWGLSATAQAQAAAAPSQPPLSSAMDGRMFYQLLLGEFNARDGNPLDGFNLILDAARKTGDARLYKRAVDIALRMRDGANALMAARAWKQAMPTSVEANSYVLQILIDLNRLPETVEPLKREVALAEPLTRGVVIQNMPRYFERVSNKAQAAKTVELALADYLNSPELGAAAWAAVGRMRLAGSDNAGALAAGQKAQSFDPNSDMAAALGLYLMTVKEPQGETLVTRYLLGAPKLEMRMDYMRTLVNLKRYPDALAQIKTVTQQHPEQLDAWLIQGTLELEMQQYEAAQASLEHYVNAVQASQTEGRTEAADRGLVQAYLDLARLSEKKKDYVAAENWLNRIGDSGDVFEVQLRRANAMAEQGKLTEARALIHALPERTPEDARTKISAEATLLRDAKQFQAAYDVLSKAIAKSPADYELMYDQAMLSEKLGRMDDMERLLRKVIAAKPDYQHAYNALGYSLADHNTRLPEARKLVQKALELSPGDPFISDSLGWVEFRAGNNALALDILRTAYKSKPDPEIAAHLGEVLWALGQQDEAKSVWREGLQMNNDNETLQETLKRLQVKL